MIPVNVTEPYLFIFGINEVKHWMQVRINRILIPTDWSEFWNGILLRNDWAEFWDGILIPTDQNSGYVSTGKSNWMYFLWT